MRLDYTVSKYGAKPIKIRPKKLSFEFALFRGINNSVHHICTDTIGLHLTILGSILCFDGFGRDRNKTNRIKMRFRGVCAAGENRQVIFNFVRSITRNAAANCHASRILNSYCTASLEILKFK